MIWAIVIWLVMGINILSSWIVFNLYKRWYRPVYFRRNVPVCQMLDKGVPVFHKEREKHRTDIIWKIRKYRADIGAFRQVFQKVTVIFLAFTDRIPEWIMKNRFKGSFIPFLDIENFTKHKFRFPENIIAFFIIVLISCMLVGLSGLKSLIPKGKLFFIDRNRVVSTITETPLALHFLTKFSS